MRSIRTLAWLATVASVSAGMVYGCSAGANDPTGDEQDATVGAADAAWSDGGGGSEGGGKDSGGPNDAAADVKVDTGAPGTVCPDTSIIENQNCGICGNQSRGCFPSDAGVPLWGDWGACGGEKDGGCDPSMQYPDSDCGRCGKKPQICQANCEFAQGLVCQEPAGVECAVGDVAFFPGLSCPATQGRYRSCESTCKYGAPGGCTNPGTGGVVGTQITISGFQNTSVDAVYSIAASPDQFYPNTFTNQGRCPISLQTAKRPYKIFSVRNTTIAPATVSIYTAKPTGSTLSGTYIAVYDKNPVSEADFAACLDGTFAESACSEKIGVPESCASGFAGLMAGDNQGVRINANQTLYVVVWAKSTSLLGNFTAVVRTVSVP